MKFPETDPDTDSRQLSRGFSEQLRGLGNRLKMADLIFDHIENGALVTDAEGYILYFNRPYAEFLGVEAKNAIGKHATDVLENSRMHIVARTGKAEVNEIFTTKGRDMVVQRIPIFEDGKVVAVFGQLMFKQISDVSPGEQPEHVGIETEALRKRADLVAGHPL